MKKTLIALAAVAATGAVFAQSSATISGSISVGVMDTGAKGAKAAVSSLGGGANAININTTEDLGGGLRAGLTSQMRFNASTGDVNSSGTGNALFHAANVYVGGSFGTVRIGKIAEASNCAFDPWGCTGGAGLMGGVGVSSLIAAGTQASSVSYATPTIAGFSAGFQTSVSSRDNERSVLNVNYTAGPLNVQYLRSQNSANVVANGALGAAATAPTDVKGSGQSIGASYNFGPAAVHFVNAVTENAAKVKTAKVNSLGVTAPLGAITLLAGYSKDSAKAADADTKIAFGANYALSKRTTVGADIFRAEGQAAVAPATGKAGTGFVVRARHTF